MLIHHSAEDYGVAAKRAADWATEKLEAIIAAGKAKAISTIQEVQRMQPKDYVVASNSFRFLPKENAVDMMINSQTGFRVHPHALEQIGTRCDMPSPKRTVDWLLEGERGPSTLAHVLNQKYQDIKDKRFLLRTVNDGELRGFLSDRYRRLDSAPIVEAFIERMTHHGAVPSEGRALDTKFFLKVVLPHVFEPIPGEVMLWGALLKNSDFGDGKLEICGFVHRLRCTNLAISEDGFSKIHLGGRLGEEIEFSQRTYELDTQTTASAVKDVIDAVFEPSNVKRRMDIIQYLGTQNVEADAVLKGLRTKSKLTKGEADEVAKIFSSADIEMLPPGQTAWRLSNAISLLAQGSDPGRQLDLEEVAGEVAGLRKAA